MENARKNLIIKLLNTQYSFQVGYDMAEEKYKDSDYTDKEAKSEMDKFVKQIRILSNEIKHLNITPEEMVDSGWLPPYETERFIQPI